MEPDADDKGQNKIFRIIKNWMYEEADEWQEPHKPTERHFKIPELEIASIITKRPIGM